MASSLDMSLEDRIKINKRRDQPRGGRAGRSSFRRFGSRRSRQGRQQQDRSQQLRVNSSGRSSSYSIAKSFSRAKEAIWQHDTFEDTMAAIGGGRSTKLYISNLDYGVTNQDLKELFAEVGDLKSSTIHYDRSGRPNGTAEVVFVRAIDAITAMKQYNNVQLDGKPMRIELVGTALSLPVIPQAKVSGGSLNKGKMTVSKTSGYRLAAGGVLEEQRGGASKNRQRGRASRPKSRARRGGRRRNKASPKSAEELDKELENYHAEAMETT